MKEATHAFLLRVFPIAIAYWFFLPLAFLRFPFSAFILALDHVSFPEHEHESRTRFTIFVPRKYRLTSASS